MRRLILLCSILLLSFPAFSVSGTRVKYVGGTAPGMHSDVVGRLDTTSPDSLVFRYQGRKVLVPYANIESFQHTTEVARHLGALPALFVVLVKARQRRHFFRIAYCDRTSASVPLENVVILEVPKGMAPSLEAVLDTRAPHRGRSCNYWGCWQ